MTAGKLAGRKVCLSLLTWNTRDISRESLAALLAEAERLRREGAEPWIVVCDNGSTDGTREALRAAGERLTLPHRFVLNDRNRGSSVARNAILDLMLEAGADYLLLMDGDIEIVPGSGVAMLRHLEQSAPQVGCLGAHCHGQTRRRELATPYLSNLAATQVSDDRHTLWVAWTQYGFFRRALFEAGVRFDENPPFDRPGWGCEDVDLAFQIHSKGFYNQVFAGMTYLHRDVNSSIPLLRELGLDPRADYNLRRRYVIEKWQGTSLGAATLEYLRGADAEPSF
jgi:glycosyltransferase involved in cell wall biosynthesis